MAPRVSSPTFVGRRAELDRFAAALADVSGERPVLLLVAGEAGVGKSRFLREAIFHARESGARTLRGGCVDLGSGSLPYEPIVEALRDLGAQLPPADLERRLGTGRTDVLRLLPELRLASEVTAAPTAETGSAQGRLFEHFSGLLVRLAHEKPILLALEDIHWADRSTLDLVQFLAHTLRDAPVLIVATYRADELHRSHPLLPFLAEMERSGRADQLELNRFDRPELAQLLSGIMGTAPDRKLVDDVFVRSDGNAFFAEELVASGLDRRDLAPSLRHVLLARVASLGDETQDLLGVVAGAGREVSADVLERVAGLDPEALVRPLREAVARQVLVVSEGGGIERYGFRHALMQEAIYQDLLPTERTKLHAAFASAIAAMTGSSTDASRAAELAHHWYAAHDLPRALVSSVDAAAAAEHAYAFAEALSQYERALALWDRVSDASERLNTGRLELLERAARAAAVTDPARAVSHIREAITLVDPDVDPARAGLLYERLGRYSWLSATPGTLAAYREAVRLVPKEPPSAARARVLAGLAQFLMGGSDTEAAALAAEAIEMCRVVGARDVEAHALVTLGSALGLLGRIDESLETLDQAKRVATEIGAIEDLVRAYKYIGGTLYLVWRNEEAAAALYTGFELAQRHGLVGSHGLDSLNTRFWALMDGGRWGEAEHTADLIERNRPQAPSTLAAMILHATPAALAIATGRIEEAERHITALEALAERDEEGGVRGEALGARASLSLVQGRPLETRKLVRLIMAATEAREGTPRSIAESHALGIRAEAEVAASSRRGGGETRRTASAVATDHLDHMRELHASVKRERPAFAPQTEAYLALCEAEAGRVDGRADPAAWSVAARRFEALGTPLHVAYARFREGEALLASSRARAEARGSLGEAYRIAVRIGATPLLDDIEALARHARLPLPQPESGEAATPTHDRFGLTKREREVLELLAAGNTNRQIATTLYISEKTAGAHVSKILSKLDVRGRTEAAAVAHREGLLVPASQSLVAGDVLR